MSAADTAGVCSRCQQPIAGFAPPCDGVTAGYYLASAFPRYANEGDVYICDACMWRDPLYILDHGRIGND
ncbi:hypothetical protein [Humibacter sp.]|uniref:hypothetical protein n=1 Tax=Humibacter sp. TaxID=1940291 RepID=UPI003F817CE2